MEPAKKDEIDFGVGMTRLSLAYGQLNKIRSDIVACVGKRMLFLDLSHNDFQNLAFLQHFPALQTLVLDRNCKLDYSTLPKMENLRILWLNNCNLINISDWLIALQEKCPNLEELSMMCNPVGETILNGVTERQERKYRKKLIKMFPRLNHFDGVAVTEAERRKANKSTNCLPLIPLFQNIVRRKLGNCAS